MGDKPLETTPPTKPDGTDRVAAAAQIVLALIIAGLAVVDLRVTDADIPQAVYILIAGVGIGVRPESFAAIVKRTGGP